MKKFITSIIFIIKILITTIIALCGFGGGCLIYFTIALLFKININETIFILSILIPVPISWWLAPKISEKFY